MAKKIESKDKKSPGKKGGKIAQEEDAADRQALSDQGGVGHALGRGGCWLAYVSPLSGSVAQVLASLAGGWSTQMIYLFIYLLLN